MAVSVLSMARSLKLGLSLTALFAFNASQAQGPVAGYEYLGACGTHHYYISKNYIAGNQISTAVADFRAKTAVPDENVYAAAILNETENNCIRDMMVAYNGNMVKNPQFNGVPLSTF